MSNVDLFNSSEISGDVYQVRIRIHQI